jgi:pimeloyl-ACP methyl ester carboxylesterase
LLAYHRLREDVTLVGYSMGGTIATAFAAEQPHLIKRLILFAPSGVIMRESRFSRFCSRVPLLGDWVHAMFMRRRTMKAIPQRGQTKEIETVLRTNRRELNRRGYLPAILSSRRGILTEVQEKEHRQFSRQGIPVVAIWAENDAVVPLSAIGRLAEWNRSAHQEVVNHAGHDFVYTHGQQVAAALREALHD